MLWMLLLWACEGPPAPTAEAPASKARGRVLRVSVGPVSSAHDLVISVGPVQPQETVHVAWSAVGPGAGPCPPALGGACLGLQGARYLGVASVDLSGWGSLTLPPQPLAAGVSSVWVQAVVVDATGEVHLSDLAERVVRDPGEVHPGDLVLSSVADLAAARDVVAVEGDVVVEATGLEEVELLALEEVGGSVRVWENEALELWRAPLLRTVGRDLSLYDNPMLTTVGELTALAEVGGTLSVHRMAAVEGLDLPALRDVGALYLFHDQSLTDLDGLASLETVAGPAELWELYALQRLQLPALRQVQGRLDVFEADELGVVDLPLLEQVGGLELHECDGLVDLGELPSLVAIDNALTLKYCSSLATVEGLSALQTAGSVEVEHLPSLATLPLPALQQVDGAVVVVASGVQELGLWGLVAAGSVEVRNLAGLHDLGLESLEEVGGVVVRGNEALSHCEIEAWLEEVSFATVSCSGNLEDGCSAWCEGAP